jgi:hypothetical protein
MQATLAFFKKLSVITLSYTLSTQINNLLILLK